MRSFLALVASMIALGGCTSLALRGADPGSLRSATLVEACPLGVPGTRVVARETREGVEVLFATRAANVDELRVRARDQARVNGPDRHRGRGHLGEHRGARDHGLRLWTLAPVRATVDDTANGARILVVPVDPSERSEVLRVVVERVAQIEAAGCF